jgi:hypothetical protein
LPYNLLSPQRGISEKPTSYYESLPKPSLFFVSKELKGPG